MKKFSIFFLLLSIAFLTGTAGCRTLQAEEATERTDCPPEITEPADARPPEMRYGNRIQIWKYGDEYLTVIDDTGINMANREFSIALTKIVVIASAAIIVTCIIIYIRELRH